jgi:hypothetical protein
MKGRPQNDDYWSKTGLRPFSEGVTGKPGRRGFGR